MGKTIDEWNKYLKGLSDSQLQAIVDCVDELMDYGEIAKEFGWTKIDILGSLAKIVLRERSE